MSSMNDDNYKLSVIKNADKYNLGEDKIIEIANSIDDAKAREETIAKIKGTNDEDTKTEDDLEANNNEFNVDYETQSGSVPESSPEVPEVPIEEVNSAVIDGNTMAVVRSKVIAIKDGVNSRIRELVDTKGGRKLAATLGTLGLAAVVLTGPVGGTVLGTIAAGVGSTAFIGGGGVLTAAAVKEFEKGRKL